MEIVINLRKSILSFFMVSVICSVFLMSCQKAEMVDDGINVADKREVIRLILEKAILEKHIPDYYSLTKDKTKIVISTENIKETDLPSLPGITFELLTPSQIKKKANWNGDYLYLTFAPFKQEGSSIYVSLNNNWAKSIWSFKTYLSGGGFKMKYTKLDGNWDEEEVGWWIS